jgi:hypothetical protein
MAEQSPHRASRAIEKEREVSGGEPAFQRRDEDRERTRVDESEECREIALLEGLRRVHGDGFLSGVRRQALNWRK